MSSFVSTFFQRNLNEKLGRSGSFLTGALLCTLSLAMCYYIDERHAWLMYPVVLILGVGNSTIMVASVCMEADLVGNNTESGAFGKSLFRKRRRPSPGIGGWLTPFSVLLRLRSRTSLRGNELY